MRCLEGTLLEGLGVGDREFLDGELAESGPTESGGAPRRWRTQCFLTADLHRRSGGGRQKHVKGDGSSSEGQRAEDGQARRTSRGTLVRWGPDSPGQGSIAAQRFPIRGPLSMGTRAEGSELSFEGAQSGGAHRAVELQPRPESRVPLPVDDPVRAHAWSGTGARSPKPGRSRRSASSTSAVSGTSSMSTTRRTA